MRLSKKLPFSEEFLTNLPSDFVRILECVHAGYLLSVNNRLVWDKKLTGEDNYPLSPHELRSLDYLVGVGLVALPESGQPASLIYESKRDVARTLLFRSREWREEGLEVVGQRLRERLWFR
jgi:hypothetical protein